MTINLMAPGWFSQRNDYDGYTQMYERAVNGGQMRLDNSDPKNSATMRAAADDIATMPSAWANLQFTPTMTGGSWDRREVKVTKGPAPTRGLAPRARGAAHLIEEVKFSGGITQLCISGRDLVREADGRERPLTGGEFQDIQTNARTFAAKHGARLLFID